MDDPTVYTQKLSAFGRMLRLEGLSVSPRETEDASRILIQLGFSDRSTVKTALRTVYAKTQEQQLLFDKVFDGFFISEEAMRKQAKEQMERQAQAQRNREQAQEELEAVGLSEDQLNTYATMPQSARDRLQKFMDKYKSNAERNPELYGNFIHSVFAKTILEEQLRMEDAGIGVQAADPELGLLFRDISEFRDVEIPKAISIIQGICSQINGELTAKRNRGGHSGKLDFRGTIRKGLETGGSLYRLKYKKKRTRKRHLVLLCDVSGSMVQFSEFALRFIQSLNQISDSSRVFLFSEQLFEADPFSLQNMDLFRSYVNDCGIYGKGTDLGMALRSLSGRRPPILNGATTLLILSDTKTIDQKGAISALLEVKRQAGSVLWLNPIGQHHWPHVRSIQNFSALCPMVACNTLSALAAACRKLTID
ncbi:MAG: VWA domain-containing protein [Ruminococcaceae bacterium]|nr:VWA domain-containing protein [Oscillospiraceae bacterium]